MGAKLSRRKKGCMGDSNDEKGEQISETSTIEQKDNETDADCEETNVGKLNKNQEGTDPMPCEEQPKNEPQVDETVHQEHKSTVEATQDQTKESPIAHKNEDIETVQIKREENEMQKVAEVTAEQTCEIPPVTTAETKTERKCAHSEQLPAKQTEEKHKINPAKDLSTCSPIKETNTAASSDITLENASKKPVVNENSNDRSKSEEYVCSLTVKPSNIQSTENKKSDSEPMNSRQLNSGNEAHLVSHIDTVAQIHSLNDSKNILNHANESSMNNSDSSEIVSKLPDASDHCGVLNIDKGIKPEEKVSPLSECVHQDEKCIHQADTSTKEVEESSRPPMIQETSTDQTSCMRLTESDTKLESSPSLEHNLVSSKIETEIEGWATNSDAVVVTPTEQECAQALTEVELEAQQKATVSPDGDDVTAGKRKSVAESVMGLKSSSAKDVNSPLALADCAAPEEGYSSDVEALVASPQETSHDELSKHSGIAVLAYSAEPETCKESTEVMCTVEGKGSKERTSPVELPDCKSTKVEAPQPELAGSSDLIEVTSRAETEEVIHTEMLSPTKQKEGGALEEVACSTEIMHTDAEGETACPDELEDGLSPADIGQPTELEGTMFQVASQDELGTCADQSEVVLTSEPEEFVLQKSSFEDTNIETPTLSAETDCPAEQQTYATPSEQCLCVDTVTPNLSKLDEHITSDENSSPKPDTYEESTEISPLPDPDANTTQEKHVAGEMSAEENTLPMSSCYAVSENEVFPLPAEQANRHLESISLKESENHNESNGNLSPAHVICEKLSPKYDSIASEALSNGDSEINGEHDNPMASNGSSIDLLNE